LAYGAPFYRFLALAIFAAAAGLYAFTLPAVYTGGVIGLISLRYLNAELLFFSLALAAAVSLALTLNIYAYRNYSSRRSSGVTVGAALSSIVPASLCCTPLLPALLALFGATTPQIFGINGRVQGFIASYETPILIFALLLLLYAIRLGAKIILLRARPLSEGRRSTDEP